ncbi:MAG: 4-hydroxy-tetrahydrodipicolinate synthase [Bacteroidales bacterium]|nr:4-hydroxy-tetrahydrodipicolinate synthase [Bacteroidales bacterium]
MIKKLKGTGVAIVTPFRKDGSLDFNALRKLVNFLIENGVNYIVALGTTGESVTLSKDEKSAVISIVKETINGRIPLVVGIGGNNTREVINTINCTDFEGIDAILSVAPYYNKPSQEGIYQHYNAIAQTSPVPVILYNVPGRTGVNITSETTLRLAKLKNVCAIKEASGNLMQIMEIIKNKPKSFLVISGDDSLALPIIMLGGTGIISVIANALPAEFSSMVRLAVNKKYDEAIESNNKLLEMYSWLFVEGNPSGIKASLSILKIIENNLRLPLVPVSKKTYQKLEELIQIIKK